MSTDAQAIFYGLAVIAFVAVLVIDIVAAQGVRALGLIALGLALATFVAFYNALDA